MYFNDNDIVKFLFNGKAILVTGAGFTHAMKNKVGQNIPLGQKLSEDLWYLAYEHEEYSKEFTLQDCYEAAEYHPEKLEKYLNDVFTVDSDSISDRFRYWFELPWDACYTFNVDDSMSKIVNKYTTLLDKYQIIDGINEKKIINDNKTKFVNIHGKLENFPNVTFTSSQYRNRCENLDVWYTNFSTDVTHSPVFYIGTSLTEPALDRYIELLGPGAGINQASMPTFLVTPSISKKTELLLKKYKMQHIKMNELEFYKYYIEPNIAEYIAQREEVDSIDSNNLIRIKQLIESSKEGDDSYLEGRTPRWKDLTSGSMVRFTTVDEVTEYLVANNAKNVTVLRGSSGSGKTSLLMMISLELDSQGKSVYWLPDDNNLELSEIVKLVNSSDCEYLFVDDIDRFSELGIEFFRQNIECHVVGAVRRMRSESLYGSDLLKSVKIFELENLSEDDSERLVNILDKKNKLAKYLADSKYAKTKKSKDDIKEDIISEISHDKNRNLLSMMILARTGKKFRDYVWGECVEINQKDSSIGGKQTLYATLCFLNKINHKKINKKDLFNIHNNLDQKQLSNDLDSLIKMGLVYYFDKEEKQVHVKHRVIAEESIRYYAKAGSLTDLMEGIAHWSYDGIDESKGLRDKKAKILQRCIDHKEIKKIIKNTPVITEYYENLSKFLRDYMHFWLQKGSFETEIGTDEGYKAAAESLMAASLIKHDDIFLLTASHYLQLKRGMSLIDDLDKRQEVLSSIHDLCDLVVKDKKIKRSPNTIKILLEYTSKILIENLYFDSIEKRKLAMKVYPIAEECSTLYSDVPVKHSWQKFNEIIIKHYPNVPNVKSKD